MCQEPYKKLERYSALGFLITLLDSKVCIVKLTWMCTMYVQVFFAILCADSRPSCAACATASTRCWVRGSHNSHKITLEQWAQSSFFASLTQLLVSIAHIYSTVCSNVVLYIWCLCSHLLIIGILVLVYSQVTSVRLFLQFSVVIFLWVCLCYSVPMWNWNSGPTAKPAGKAWADAHVQDPAEHCQPCGVQQGATHGPLQRLCAPTLRGSASLLHPDCQWLWECGTGESQYLIHQWC